MESGSSQAPNVRLSAIGLIGRSLCLKDPQPALAALVTPYLAMRTRSRDGEKTLLKERVVTVLLVVVPATAALLASTGAVQAVEECRLEPGLAAPSGTEWNYRINRDHHRCWFLSSRAVRSHHTQLRRSASVGKHHAATGDALAQDQTRDSDLPAASPSGKTNIAAAAEQFAVPQAATTIVEQSSANLIPRIVPTITYKAPPATPETVLGQTVSAARVAERTPASATNTNFDLLAGAAAALLVAGGTFHFTRRGQRKSHNRHTGQTRRATRGAAAIRSEVAPEQLRIMTDPAKDPKRSSVVEVRRDLQAASETRDLRPSHRKSAWRDAILLPPAASGLNQRRDERTMEPATHEVAEA